MILHIKEGQCNNGFMLVSLTFVTQMIAAYVSEQHAASDTCGYVGGPEEES